MERHHSIVRNQQGIALLIVLLVTTLLMALIFEFAYGTRVSLRAAANFRDAERADQLARAGIKLFVKSTTNADYDLRNLVPPNEWFPVPVVSKGDTDVRIRWEDERAKIPIIGIRSNNFSYTMFENLFSAKGVSQEVRDRIHDDSNIQNLSLLSGLHKYMSDDDYRKVKDFLTVENVGYKINIRTASIDVLKSIGVSDTDLSSIKDARANWPPSNDDMNGIISRIKVILPNSKGEIEEQAGISFLTTNYSNFVTIRSVAVVGGYTKEITAIINLPSEVRYWRTM